ncbi:MAG: hypothetical protein KC486_06195, partial [Myxococcales bacterium]|nr:hypothetical protein [Myxococcales bacterium]
PAPASREPAPGAGLEASATAIPPPFAPLSGWEHGVWSDGTVMLVADFFGVTLYCREGQAGRSPEGVRDFAGLAASGQGERFVAAGVGEEGGVVIWREGRWHKTRAPTVDDDELIAVAVDDAGAVYAAGQRRALYVARGDDWSVHRYPAELKGEVAAAVWLGGGELLLVGSDGLALRFMDGAFSRSARVPAEVTESLTHAWSSPGGDLWLAGDGELLRVRPDGALSRRRPPIFGKLSGLSGVHTEEGDVVAVSAQSEVVLFDGVSFSRVDGDYSFPEGIYLDGAGEVLYLAHRDGLRRLAVNHPKIVPQGLPAGATCPLPSRPQDAEWRAELERNELIEPVERPVLEEVKPGKPTPRQSMPIGRIALGVASGAVPAEPGAEPGRGAAFALDVGVGGTLGLAKYVSIWPEIGYAYSRLPNGANHLFLVGIGPLFGSKMAAVGVLPRFALGGSENLFGVGVRTGLVGSFLLDMIAVEVAHQWLHADQREIHEVRTMISINGVPLLLAASLARIFSGGRRGLFRRRR